MSEPRGSEPGTASESGGELRIGTSGYQYDHWRGRFYPPELAKKRWFDWYTRQFDTVEINNTFYRLPEGEVFACWRDAAPRGFRYAVKYSRFATHMKKLKDPEEPIERFTSRAARLGDTIGPVLVQLPPGWGPDVGRLDAFLAAVPRRFRWVVELRDPRWVRDDVFDTLARHGAALCIHDMLPGHPRVLTADLVYLRFHGVEADRAHYQGSYGDERLRAEAEWIAGQRALGRDVWAYFNNDDQAFAVGNALALRRFVGEAEGRPLAASRG